MRKTWIPLAATAGLLVLFSGVLSAESDVAKRARNAADVLNDMMAADDSAIPDWILDRAEGIVVIPSVKKLAFGFGGRFGKGLGVFRTADGRWGPPVFFSLTGGSFGLQIGGQEADVVLVVMNDDGARSLLGDKVELGGGAGVSAGPVGRNASADTNLRMRAKILSYARSRGIFVGAMIEGAVLKPDSDMDEKAYGRRIGARELAFSEGTPPPEGTLIFVKTVKKYAPNR
jgi:lipid-binding SYLF domain-containing protein